MDKKKVFKDAVHSIYSLIPFMLLMFTIQSSFIQPFKVPSGSMFPTIFIGDRIFASKLTYEFRVPFSRLLLQKPISLFNRRVPQRGEVIVFLNPVKKDVNYIKRVIGTPGDVIEIRNKVLYINQVPMVQHPVNPQTAQTIFAKMAKLDPIYEEKHFDLLEEDLQTNNNKICRHSIIINRQNSHFHNFGPVTVPIEHLFVMGDNRDLSADSRVWGFVPYQEVQGSALVIWSSYYLDVFNNIYQVYWERFGQAIQCPESPSLSSL